MDIGIHFYHWNYAKCMRRISVSSLIRRYAPRSRLRRLFNEITLRAPVDLQHNVITRCTAWAWIRSDLEVGSAPASARPSAWENPGFFVSVRRREKGGDRSPRRRAL